MSFKSDQLELGYGLFITMFSTNLHRPLKCNIRAIAKLHVYLEWSWDSTQVNANETLIYLFII